MPESFADPNRSLEQALAELRALFKQMRLDDRRRGRCALRIVQLEDEIEDRARRAAEPAPVPLCLGCPPVGYPTDETRCLPCPRRRPEPAARS